LSFYEGVGVGLSESEVLKIEESESELLCTDCTALALSVRITAAVVKMLCNIQDSESQRLCLNLNTKTYEVYSFLFLKYTVACGIYLERGGGLELFKYLRNPLFCLL
jgi:hypothetical protein